MTRLVWDNNRLDTGYLRFRSFCWFCRIGEQLVIQYDFRDIDEDGLPVWSASIGSYEISYELFMQEMENFLHHFFLDMEKQFGQWVTYHPEFNRLA